jgi:hypothetical protein
VKSLLRFPLDSEHTILIEVDEPAEMAGMVEAGRADKVIEQVQRTFGDALGTLKPTAQTIISQFRGMDEPPDEFVVHFGLKVTAGAGRLRRRKRPS